MKKIILLIILITNAKCGNYTNSKCINSVTISERPHKINIGYRVACNYDGAECEEIGAIAGYKLVGFGSSYMSGNGNNYCNCSGKRATLPNVIQKQLFKKEDGTCLAPGETFESFGELESCESPDEDGSYQCSWIGGGTTTTKGGITTLNRLEIENGETTNLDGTYIIFLNEDSTYTKEITYNDGTFSTSTYDPNATSQDITTNTTYTNGSSNTTTNFSGGGSTSTTSNSDGSFTSTTTNSDGSSTTTLKDTTGTIIQTTETNSQGAVISDNCIDNNVNCIESLSCPPNTYDFGGVCKDPCTVEIPNSVFNYSTNECTCDYGYVSINGACVPEMISCAELYEIESDKCLPPNIFNWGICTQPGVTQFGGTPTGTAVPNFSCDSPNNELCDSSYKDLLTSCIPPNSISYQCIDDKFECLPPLENVDPCDNYRNSYDRNCVAPDYISGSCSSLDGEITLNTLQCNSADTNSTDVVKAIKESDNTIKNLEIDLNGKILKALGKVSDDNNKKLGDLESVLKNTQKTNLDISTKIDTTNNLGVERNGILEGLDTKIKATNDVLGSVDVGILGLKEQLLDIATGDEDKLASSLAEKDSIFTQLTDSVSTIEDLYSGVTDQVDSLNAVLDNGFINSLPTSSVSNCPYVKDLTFDWGSVPISIDGCAFFTPIYGFTYYLFYVIFFISFLGFVVKILFNIGGSNG